MGRMGQRDCAYAEYTCVARARFFLIQVVLKFCCYRQQCCYKFSYNSVILCNANPVPLWYTLIVVLDLLYMIRHVYEEAIVL